MRIEHTPLGAVELHVTPTEFAELHRIIGRQRLTDPDMTEFAQYVGEHWKTIQMENACGRSTSVIVDKDDQ